MDDKSISCLKSLLYYEEMNKNKISVIKHKGQKQNESMSTTELQNKILNLCLCLN